MISFILSMTVMLAAVAIMLRMVVRANREPAPVNLASGRYQGRDMDAFTKAWKRKAWLKKQGLSPAESLRRQQADREDMA